MSAEIKPEIDRVYSTTEAKNQFSAMLNFVAGEGEAVIIESHGRPRAALISHDDLPAFKKLKEKQRLERAWEELEALRMEVSSGNADLAHLSDDELMEFTDQAVHEAFQDLHDSGRLYRKSPVAQ
jgi:prevent-host-death family protein